MSRRPAPPETLRMLPLVSLQGLLAVPFTRAPGIRRMLEDLARDPAYVGASAIATRMGCHLIRHSVVPRHCSEGALATWIKPQYLAEIQPALMPPARLIPDALAELKAWSDAQARAKAQPQPQPTPVKPAPEAPKARTAPTVLAQDPVRKAPGGPAKASKPAQGTSTPAEAPKAPQSAQRSRTMLAWDLVANHGMTVADAASKVGISERAVYRAQHRARTRDLCPDCGQVVRAGFKAPPRR